VASYRYWPNGLEEGRCYDPAGRATAIVTGRSAFPEDCSNAPGMVSRFDYFYDANGNRTRQLERRTDPGSTSLGAQEEARYGYDALDRLVGVGCLDLQGVRGRMECP
jgi:hypothetical protein